MKHRRYVILDRDGTLIVERNYLSDPVGVELERGAVSALRCFEQLGLDVVVVTNQSGVGRGYFSGEAVDSVHQRLAVMLKQEGVQIPKIYSCLHAPWDGCECRKPGTGLVRRAAAELGFDPAESFVIGDNRGDMGLGKSIGATAILVMTGHGRKVAEEGNTDADYVVEGLPEAADVISLIIGRAQ